MKGYLIERKEPNGSYKTISLAPIQETSCTDYDVVAGHTYIYQARTVSLAGAVSLPSGEATASVQIP